MDPEEQSEYNTSKEMQVDKKNTRDQRLKHPFYPP